MLLRVKKIFKMTYYRDAACAEYTNEIHTSDNRGTSTLIIKYPDHIPVKHDSNEVQNTDTMGTEHILLRVRMLQYKTFTIGNKITWNTYCKHRTAATIYTSKS